jgi:hypothetical protein
MKKLVIVLLASALAAGGCNFVMGPDKPAGGGKGNLAISLGGGDAGNRAITSGAGLPAELLATLRYELVLSGPDGETLSRTVTGGETLRMTAALGDWRIDAMAFKEDGLAGTGSVTFTVTPGLNSVRVPMILNEGYFDIEIDVDSLVHGTFGASFNAAFPGTTITVTVTPDTGYVLKTGTLKYNDGTDRIITGGPPYTFTMPAGNVTVYAGFEKDTTFSISDVQVYNPDDTPFSGNISLDAVISHVESSSSEPVIPLDPVGSISAGKLTLNLPALTDDQLFLLDNGKKGGVINFRFGSSFSDLSLLDLDAPELEGFMIAYVSDDCEIDDVSLEKGWNFGLLEWILDEPDSQHAVAVSAHPMQWFTTSGYKWVYNADPLPGTWKHLEKEYTFSRTTFPNGSFSYEDSSDSSHNMSGAFAQTAGEITFTPASGTPWTQRYFFNGNMLELVDTDYANSKTYLRVPAP